MSPTLGTFVLTGANGGLGRAIVAQFLSRPESSDYKGLWGVRDPAKAADLLQILNRIPHSAERHPVVKIDIGTLKNVRAAAADINERVASGALPPIRVLVLNAAVQFVTGQMHTDEGLESTFAVNYVANFLLAALLMQSIDKDMGRIVIISSWTHDPPHPLNGHIVADEHYTIFRDSLETLARPAKDQKDDEYNSGMRRYGASKTLIIMIMYEFQRRLAASKELANISVLAIDPGAMPGTSLIRDSSLSLRVMVHGLMGTLTPLLQFFFPNGYFRTPNKSAHDVLNACFDESKIGRHPKGLYLNGSAVIHSSAETRQEEKQKRLWKQTIDLTELRKEETVLDIE